MYSVLYYCIVHKEANLLSFDFHGKVQSFLFTDLEDAQAELFDVKSKSEEDAVAR